MRTEKQAAFVEAFCLTGNATKAAEMAGYGSAKQRGHELKNKFSKKNEIIFVYKFLKKIKNIKKFDF